jgi:hypothetical protein
MRMDNMCVQVDAVMTADTGAGSISAVLLAASESSQPQAGRQHQQGADTQRTAYLLAYLSVLIVSSKFQSAGPTLATITVLVLPPKLSCRSRVSLESLRIHDNTC